MSDKLPLYKQHGTYNCYRGPLRCRCDKCVEAASVARKASKERSKLGNWEDRPCIQCGDVFSPGQRRSGPIPKKCKICRDANNKPAIRKCQLCNRPFAAVGTSAYCQDVCVLVGKKIKERIRMQKRREQGKCGRHGVEGFCDKCHLTNFRKVQVRKRAYTGETSSAVEMARAQKWKCSLCAGRLDTKYVWPHALSLTVDHTVPRSLGGTDDPANLTAAHLVCNTKKNNRTLGPEQLRLVG